MANTEVLLLKYIPGLGSEGEQVRVRSGYARNYLLPQKMAISLNYANVKHIEALKKARNAREMQEKQNAEVVAEKIKQVTIAIAVKTGEEGKLFGSVTPQDILTRLQAQGIELDRKQLHLYTPIKSLGSHPVSIRLHPEVAVDLNVEVVSENPIERKESAEKSTSDESGAKKAKKKPVKAKEEAKA